MASIKYSSRMDIATLLEKLTFYGVGHRKLDDPLLSNYKPPSRLGVYDEDDEQLCHEIIQTSCNIPGCKFTAESLLEFENHYNASHRYACSQCKKVLPSPHLLDLHLQENHDSFFAVMAEKKPSYGCYIEECKEKFMNTDERLEHCVREHKLPKDFRFEQQKNKRKSKTNKNVSMELDETTKKVFLTNSKQKTFQYTGRRFTKNNKERRSVDMDDVMEELKESLPE